MVKKTINALACALIAPLAFAQPSTTTTKQKTRIQPTTRTETIRASTPTPGTVATFEPGEVIVVGSENRHDTFSYVLDETVRYVNKAGKKIDEHRIKPGTRVHVYYDDTGQTPIVDHVVVDEH
jgi:hypothetical protein